MIKAEMIKMLRHDIVTHPTQNQVNALNTKKTRIAAQNVIMTNKKMLSQEPLDDITEDEMNSARELLNNEISVVKDAMAHGDLAIDAYTKVWDECYGQVCIQVYRLSRKKNENSLGNCNLPN